MCIFGALHRALRCPVCVCAARFSVCSRTAPSLASCNTMAAQRPHSEGAFVAVQTEHEKEVHQDDGNSGTSSPRISDHLKQSHIHERDLEDPSDGSLHQVITKEGKDILVSWTREEQARVVRKADFLFLPLFAVCISRGLVAGS